MKKHTDDRRIIELFTSGKQILEIANLLAVSRATVQRRLKSANIKRDKKYTLDENAFSFFTPESCYWAGFLAADAWVGSNHKKKKFSIELAIKDISHLHKLCLFLKRQPEAVRKKTVKKSFGTYEECVLEVGNRQIVFDLVNNFDIIQNKSLILSFPNKIPYELIKHYIRGYFDGDGHISSDGIMIFNIVSASPNILPGIVDAIFKETGIELNIHHNKNMYNVQTSGTKAKAIFDWMYEASHQTTRLDRKYNRYLNYYNK